MNKSLGSNMLSKQLNKEENNIHSQEDKAFRQYDKTITKSLAEDPTDAGILFEVEAVRNHRSTKLCSCNDGSTV